MFWWYKNIEKVDEALERGFISRPILTALFSRKKVTFFPVSALFTQVWVWCFLVLVALPMTSSVEMFLGSKSEIQYLFYCFIFNSFFYPLWVCGRGKQPQYFSYFQVPWSQSWYCPQSQFVFAISLSDLRRLYTCILFLTTFFSSLQMIGA